MDIDILRDMALFVAIAQTRSFSKAAKSLGLPISTLSRRLSRLEQSLNLRLVNRTTRSLTLTVEGDVYYAHASQIVEAARLAQDELLHRAIIPHGTLRISMTVDFAMSFARSWLVEFAQKYPAISIELDVSPLHVDLLEGRFDVAFRFGELTDSGLIMRHSLKLRRSLYASPAYIKQFGSLHHPKDISKHKCIFLSSSPEKNTWSFFKGKEKITIPILNKPFWSNNYSLTSHLAQEGIGVAALSEELSKKEVATKRLALILPAWQITPISLSVLTATRLLPAKTRCFLDFFLEKLRNFEG